METDTKKALDERVTKLADNYDTAFRTAVDNFCRDIPGDDGEHALIEGFRQAMRLANAGHLLHLESDPAYPLLIKMQSLQRQMMLPSADAVYHFSRLHSDFSYRLRGSRGSAHLFQISVYAGCSAHYPDFTIAYDRDNFDGPLFAADQALDLRLGAKPRPELGEKWIPLPEGDSEIHIRQYYYNWNTERPARLLIEREDHCYPPPSMNTEDMYDRFERVNSWLCNQSSLARQYVQSFLASDTTEI